MPADRRKTEVPPLSGMTPVRGRPRELAEPGVVRMTSARLAEQNRNPEKICRGQMPRCSRESGSCPGNCTRDSLGRNLQNFTAYVPKSSPGNSNRTWRFRRNVFRKSNRPESRGKDRLNGALHQGDRGKIPLLFGIPLIRFLPTHDGHLFAGIPEEIRLEYAPALNRPTPGASGLCRCSGPLSRAQGHKRTNARRTGSLRSFFGKKFHSRLAEKSLRMYNMTS